MRTHDSVTAKFSKSELTKRQDFQAAQYAGRFDGFDRFENRYVTGALQSFYEPTVQAALEKFHALTLEGFTASTVFAVNVGAGVEFTMCKPSEVQAIELKAELEFIEQAYRQEITDFNDAFIESETEKQLLQEQRKRLAEATQAEAAHRGAIAAELRSTFGIKQ